MGKDEEIDIYEDIDDFNLASHLDKLKQDNKDLLSRTATVKNQIAEYVIAIEDLTRTEENLKENLHKLYEASTNEIAKKDKAIVELRRNLDDLTFRRKRVPTNNVVKIEKEPIKNSPKDIKIKTEAKLELIESADAEQSAVIDSKRAMEELAMKDKMIAELQETIKKLQKDPSSSASRSPTGSLTETRYGKQGNRRFDERRRHTEYRQPNKRPYYKDRKSSSPSHKYKRITYEDSPKQRRRYN